MKTKRLTIILLGLSLAVAVIWLWQLSPKASEESDGGTVARPQREPRVNDLADGGKPTNERSRTQGVLASIELVEIQQIQEFGEKYTPIPRNKTFQNPDGRTVTLQLKSEAEILRIDPSPSHSRYLVCQGATREWAVYDKQGEHLDDLPPLSDLTSDVVGHAAVQWKWRLDDALIATVETYKPRDPSVPRYPDEDNIPKVFGFYDYHLGSRTTRKINIPEEINTGLIRLEGVSEGGTLVISKIAVGGDYWGERDRSALHAFNIADTQQKKEEHNKTQQDNR